MHRCQMHPTRTGWFDVFTIHVFYSQVSARQTAVQPRTLGLVSNVRAAGTQKERNDKNTPGLVVEVLILERR